MSRERDKEQHGASARHGTESWFGADAGRRELTRAPLPDHGIARWVPALPGRGNLTVDKESAARSLGSLVLTVVELIRELMERQAIRRLDQGDLSEEQVEQIGATLMALDQRMDELCAQFELSRDELNLDFGPFGPLLSRD